MAFDVRLAACVTIRVRSAAAAFAPDASEIDETAATTCSAVRTATPATAEAASPTFERLAASQIATLTRSAPSLATPPSKRAASTEAIRRSERGLGRVTLPQYAVARQPMRSVRNAFTVPSIDELATSVATGDRPGIADIAEPPSTGARTAPTSSLKSKSSTFCATKAAVATLA